MNKVKAQTYATPPLMYELLFLWPVQGPPTCSSHRGPFKSHLVAVVTVVRPGVVAASDAVLHIADDAVLAADAVE